MSLDHFDWVDPPPLIANQVLRTSTEVLLSVGGEADMEDSAEYGELSTKD